MHACTYSLGRSRVSSFDMCVCCLCTNVCVVCEYVFVVIQASDIFRSICYVMHVRPLIHSNAMYGCPIKSRDNMAIYGFCPIISKIL